jgi:Fe-Mn family superoxide dismutase
MSNDTDRREFIRGTGMLVGTAALVGALPTAAAETTTPGKTTMTYQVKPMPFDPNKVNGLSAKLLTSHYDNNYTGAVKRLNAIQTQLAGLDWKTAPNFVINGLKREELIAANSMILHEHFFDSLGGDGQVSGPLAKAIARDFGSVANWQAEFSAIGKAEGGGSGWVILSYAPRDKRLINSWAADHTTNLAGGRPVLVFDMYEHAYHMDYGAKAAAYVDAYMAGIRWDEPSKIYERYAREA